ncbi:MAG: glycosyltransferase family 39 protein [Microgenomates group bacterium]
MKVNIKIAGWGIFLWLIIGLIFRLYNFERSFSFAHDQDLYSWIAKDILVNHHNRLVGQITSVEGVFIGSFYYYVMAIFYAVGGMNPLAASIPLLVIGLASIYSIYWVVKINFGLRAGVIAGFIYCCSYGMAVFDMWSVPTEPTLLWSIWFLATIMGLLKGNLKYLPLYGFLCGFVWQLHIALIPILPLPIMAYFVGKNKFSYLWNKNNLKIVLMSLVIFLITISPFVVFEVKHNFSQTKSMLVGINQDWNGPRGIQKWLKVTDAAGVEFSQRIFFGLSMSNPLLMWSIVAICTAMVWPKTRENKNKIWLMIGWVLMILLVQFRSKRVVSEYYFTNLVPIYVVLISLYLEKIDNKILIAIGLGYLLINGYWLVGKSDVDNSYYYRNKVVEYIKQDSVKNGYKCVAINFIADPGAGVGFRYLSWYHGLNLVKAGTPEIPVYNIAIPWQISASEESTRWGRFGIVLPVEKNISSANCEKSEYQLDPLLGYTE